MDRSGCCFWMDVWLNRTASPTCPLCSVLGRPATHRLGSKNCNPPTRKPSNNKQANSRNQERESTSLPSFSSINKEGWTTGKNPRAQMTEQPTPDTNTVLKRSWTRKSDGPRGPQSSNKRRLLWTLRQMETAIAAVIDEVHSLGLEIAAQKTETI